MAARDWSDSPLGLPQNWPAALKTVVGLMLPAKAQIVLFWGPEFAALYNDAYAPTIGNKHPKALGRPAQENWAELWDDLEPLLSGVMRTGETFSAKDRAFYIERHGVGETVYFDVSYSAVREPDGAVCGVLCIVSETTERVRAQQQITDERERLAGLFQQAPSFMAQLDGPEHVFGFTNAAYQQLIGHRNVAGKRLRDALPEVVGQGFEALMDQVYATGESYRGYAVPVRLERTPGAAPEQVMLDFVYQPIRSSAGDITGVFVDGVDVTEARRTHQALEMSEALLRESELDFRSMAEAMPNHVWTASPDGFLDWFNERTYEFSGKAEGELDGEGWGQIVHEKDLPTAAARWQAALKSGDLYQTEFRLKRADGMWRWHLARAVPIKAEDGHIVRWVGTNTDIQNQKEIAAALADLNASLEGRVQERTRELLVAEAALRQSQKMEAVGQLTGGLAHDFNNLLQGITGALDRVQHRIANNRLSEVDRFLKAANEAATRAAALTHRLLAFSRRQPLDPKPTDINRMIAGMEDLIRRTVGPNIALKVVGAGGLWATRVDTSQLESALLNLCINARDAMPDGGNLTIETANKWLDGDAARAHELSPGEYVSLCVTDTGTGMTAEVVGRAFDPFFTTKPLGQGTGLGLSMIYGFARQSGGQVRIDTELGKGTTMCLYLPRHLGPVEESGRPHDETMDRGFGETVLVVDDEATVRMLVAEVLNDNFYRTLEAVDGPSALTILESDTRIDLLITDVGLPGGMNGRQVADRARALRPELKVLFITGYAENAAVGNGYLEPGMAILAKPFAMATLGNKIREMIES